MQLEEIYATCRGRLVALAPTLTEAQAAAPLAATPPWSVLDGYRHLAGVCADMLDGVVENAGSPEWTAAQLAARAGLTVEEVAAEWATRGPEVDVKIAETGTPMAFFAFDAWTHEQDIRAAVGASSMRDDATTLALAPIALATFGRRYSSGDAPVLCVELDGTPVTLGDGEPAVTLAATPFETLRIVFGRRSGAQVGAAAWSGDPAGVAAAQEAFHLFPHPTTDITD